MRSPPSAETSIDDLSPRRRELLALLAKGLTNHELARALSITHGTVRSHVTTLLEQLGVANRTEAAARYVAWEARPAQVEVVMQRPAIAIVPLVAIGDDPRTRSLAAGLTADLASLFARWCWFPVIATTSSASARSLGSTAREVGAQLRARFLVDGTVRPVGNRWRLSVHIDDAQTGHQLWADQRDFPGEALFEMQDELCQATVAAAYPVLVARSLATAPHARPTAQLAAWELAHEGMALRASREPEANAAALSRFQEALRLEPDLVLAHYGAGLASYDALLNQWGPREAAHARLLGAAETCLQAAPHGAEGYFLLGRALQARGDWAASVRPLETAVGRNPSFALAHATLSQALQVSGRGDEALVRMTHATRLGPRSFVASLATLHFMRAEYADALQVAERAVETTPRYAYAHAIAASSCWWLGDARRGRDHLATLRERHPRFRNDSFSETFGPHVDCIERFTRGLDELTTAR